MRGRAVFLFGGLLPMNKEPVIKASPLSKCDTVVQALQDMIVKGVYKTGDQLPPEAALCEMFGVSRITVRESLKKLSMMGIVSIQQGKGTFVEGVDLGLFMKPMFQLIQFDQIDIDVLYNARYYVESGTARLAAENRTDADIARMEELLPRLDFSQPKNAALSSRLDTEFHIMVAEAAKNPLLRAAVVTLEDITNACYKRYDLYSVSLAASFEHHCGIFRAICDRDADRAEAIMRLHTVESKKVLLSHGEDRK